MVKRTDKRPRHESIAADLRAKIMAGDFHADEKIESTAQLMARYKASNPTVQNALTILKEEGFLYGERGRGVFVRDKQPFVVDVAAYFAPSPGGYSYDTPEVSTVEPPAEVAEALQLGEGGRAILRKRVTRYAGEPVELCHSYYPLDLVAGSPLSKDGKVRGGAPQALADLGYPQLRFDDQISTRVPTSEEIEVLDLPEVPVIRQFRVIFSTDDRPVEASVIIKGGHLYELRYRQVVG